MIFFKFGYNIIRSFLGICSNAVLTEFPKYGLASAMQFMKPAVFLIQKVRKKGILLSHETQYPTKNLIDTVWWTFSAICLLHYGYK